MAILSQEEIDSTLIALSKAYDEAHPQVKCEKIEEKDTPQLKGKMTYANGIVYEGSFLIDGVPNGKGKMIFPDGKKADGYWTNGKYFTDISDNEGALTVNEIINLFSITDIDTSSMFNGFGNLTYANGDIYEGNWQNKPHGKGKMIYVDGTVKEGNWIEGVFEK